MTFIRLLFNTSSRVGEGRRSRRRLNSWDSPQGSAQFVVVHVGLRFPFAPPTRHFVRVGELELAVGALPGYATGVRRVAEELQEELPKLDLSRSWKWRKLCYFPFDDKTITEQVCVWDTSLGAAGNGETVRRGSPATNMMTDDVV